jgi:hypothetical protein
MAHCLIRQAIVFLTLMLVAVPAVAQTSGSGTVDVLNAIKPALEQAQ